MTKPDDNWADLNENKDGQTDENARIEPPSTVKVSVNICAKETVRKPETKPPMPIENSIPKHGIKNLGKTATDLPDSTESTALSLDLDELEQAILAAKTGTTDTVQPIEPVTATLRRDLSEVLAALKSDRPAEDIDPEDSRDRTEAIYEVAVSAAQTTEGEKEEAAPTTNRSPRSQEEIDSLRHMHLPPAVTVQKGTNEGKE